MTEDTEPRREPIALGPIANPDPQPPDPTPARSKAVVESVPAEYDDGVQWLRSGLYRHPWAVILSLLTGWTGVWLSLWGALLGALLGILVVAGIETNPAVSHALFDIGIGQVTVLSVFLGIVLGAVGGFLFVLRNLFQYRLMSVSISFGIGAIITTFVVILIAAFERLGLRLRGYRRLSRDEVRRIAPLVQYVGQRMDLGALPRFAMDDAVIPNAWSHMRTIVITKGLLQMLGDDELEAVLAHELAHWRSGDSVGMRIVWVAALPVAVIYNLGMWLAGSTQGQAQPETMGIRAPRGFLAIVGWLIAWPAWVITTLVIAPTLAASQRQYEFEADAYAAKIGLAEPLTSALRKLGAFEGGRTGWERAVFATHPPIELRIERLQEPRPDDAELLEDDLRGPTSSELKRLLFFWRRR
ncbi:MAG TPA: M48 family metalloprotease [Acidimicrobiales bacterium]|nr:M48 family metalloprotease [Acidimicrobiales bacterium]